MSPVGSDQFVLELGVLVLGVLVLGDGLVAQAPAPSQPPGLAHVSELALLDAEELDALESLDAVDFLFDPPE